MKLDIIDTRDLYKRQQELSDLETALNDAREERAALPADASEDDIEAADKAVSDAEDCFGNDEREELGKLNDLESEIPEWRNGETMIHERDWVDYVREMLEDIGDLPKNLPHYIAINWEQTADNIAADYAQVEHDGCTYYVRNV